MQRYGLTEAVGLVLGFDPNCPEEVEMSSKKFDSSGRPVPAIDAYKVQIDKINDIH